MLIYHVATAADWAAARAAGEYATSTRGRTLADEGFLHASYADQVAGVAQRYYGGVTEPLVLLTIDPTRVGAPVVAENAGGGIELFPHIYGPLPVTAVVAVTPLARDEAGSPVIPALPGISDREGS